MWDLSSLIKDGSSRPCIKGEILTTGLPGKSPKVSVDTPHCSKMRWFLESQDLQSKRIPYSELFPDPLQHLVNDWPKVTAEQFTFPKFPQGLTTTMIKDSEVFKTPNLKQSVNIFPQQHLSELVDAKVHCAISRVREVLFCIPQSSLTIVLFLAEHPMGSPAPFTVIKGLRAIK